MWSSKIIILCIFIYSLEILLIGQRKIFQHLLCPNIHTYIHTYTHICIHRAHMHTHTQTHTHIAKIQTHIHTNRHTPSLFQISSQVQFQETWFEEHNWFDKTVFGVSFWGSICWFCTMHSFCLLFHYIVWIKAINFILFALDKMIRTSIY